MIKVVLVILTMVAVFWMLSKVPVPSKMEAERAWKEQHQDCIGGVLYYVRFREFAPAFQRDTIPKLILCDN